MDSPLGEAQRQLVVSVGMAKYIGQPMGSEQLSELRANFIDVALQTIDWQNTYRDVVPEELFSTSNAVFVIRGGYPLNHDVKDAFTHHPNYLVATDLAVHRILTDEQLERIIDHFPERGQGLKASQLIRRTLGEMK